MPSQKNKAIIACAGSGKTTTIVASALANPGKRILMLTYTNENISQIRECFDKENGGIPAGVHVRPWMTFLLQDGVRPYQNFLVPGKRIRTVAYINKKRFHKKNEYVTAEQDVYKDKLSELVYELNCASNGNVVGRLERMYDQIYIDEVQDFAAYDLNVLNDLLLSSIEITIVGDPRQATFATNNSMKNQQFKRGGIVEWLKSKESEGLVAIEEKTESHRCNQAICDFADALFPSMPSTTSKNSRTTGHDGIFHVPASDTAHYYEAYRPAVLRYSKATDTRGTHAMNMGLTKGRTYDRVLIFPTQKMLDYLTTKDPATAGDLEKLYVGITRARFSVGFVVPDRWGK